jgi:hypothetical protein
MKSSFVLEAAKALIQTALADKPSHQQDVAVFMHAERVDRKAVVSEMARPPRTRLAALKRTMVLPANAKEAKRWIDAFWLKFLSGQPGGKSVCGL